MIPSRAAGVDNFRLDASSLPAGTERMVTIESDGPWFESGAIGISFNTPHAVARRIWRTAPNRIVANLRVEAAAPQGDVRLWVRKDLASLDSQRTLSITPADPNRVTVDSAMLEEATGDPAIYPGATALLRIAGEALPDALPIRLSDRLLTAQRRDGSVFRLAVPADLPVGLATLQPDLPGRSSFPIAIELSGPPPAILDVQTSSRAGSAEGNRSYRSRILVQLPGIAPEQRANQVIRIRVNGRSILSMDRTILETPDQLQLAFELPADLTAPSANGDSTPLSVQVEWNNRHSAPATLYLNRTE
jgi:hypothetical protein